MTRDTAVGRDLLKGLEPTLVLGLVSLAIPPPKEERHQTSDRNARSKEKVQEIHKRNLPKHITDLSPQKGLPMTPILTAAPQPRGTILVGDALSRLQELETSSIDCIITSPPYFQLRDYQHQGQLGLEDAIQDWVNNLLVVTNEMARILVSTGTLWLNLGDSYSTHQREGAPHKSLLLGPERLALRLLESGWIIRNKIVWAKTNAIPSSVTDRLSCAYEVIYLLSRSPRYYFDLDQIRTPAKTHRAGQPSPPPKQPRHHTSRAPGRAEQPGGQSSPQHPGRRRHSTANPMPDAWRASNADTDHGLKAMKQLGIAAHPLGKNPTDVWRLASSNYRGPHFATYPEHLVERMLLAGCPEQRCRTCRAPYIRPIRRLGAHATRLALQPTCHCPPQPDDTPSHEPGLVLDPFLGSGTTAVVAEQHHRDWLGIEIHPDFAELAWQRIQHARTTRHGAVAARTNNNQSRDSADRKETT